MSATQEATEGIPVGQMPLVRTEMREIHRALTPDERLEKDHDLHRLKSEILEEEESLKSYTKERKGAIAKLETERDGLIELGEKGRSEFVECDVRIDEAHSRRLIVNKDTGLVIADEPLRFEDRQPCLFPATLENDAPAVPVSRQIREAFLGTLADRPGGAAVLRLHADGLLDPTDWELEKDRENRTENVKTAPELRVLIADWESDLDEFEASLVDRVVDLGIDPGTLIADLAIKSRVHGWVPADDIPDSHAEFLTELGNVREYRSGIDVANEYLMRAAAEASDPSDRSEQLASADAGETAAAAPPTVRELRTIAPADRTDRWAVDEYWMAHDAGFLDPTEEQLRQARVEFQPNALLSDEIVTLNEELDAVEQDCAAEIKTSAKARMAITRGSYPTKVGKVDDAIHQVRILRAKLEAALAEEAAA